MYKWSIVPTFDHIYKNNSNLLLILRPRKTKMVFGLANIRSIITRFYHRTLSLPKALFPRGFPEIIECSIILAWFLFNSWPSHLKRLLLIMAIISESVELSLSPLFFFLSHNPLLHVLVRRSFLALCIQSLWVFSLRTL